MFNAPWRRPAGLSIGMLAVALIVAGTFGLVAGRRNAGPAPSRGDEVVIQSFMFTPSNLTVRAGQRVVWTNDDGQPHTVTGDAAVGDSGSLDHGRTYERTFSAAGSYQYHCSFTRSCPARSP